MKSSEIPTDAIVRLVKRPTEVDAIRFDGTPKGALDLFNKFDIDGAKFVPNTTLEVGTLTIPTLEGVMTAIAGDIIIRGVKGEYYPIKPDICEATYDFACTN